MDFSTIKRKMNDKEGSGYKNVREIYADVRLIFNNAMKYNDEKSDIHVMAKTLLDKFEKKWLHLYPKVAKAVSFFFSKIISFLSDEWHFLLEITVISTILDTLSFFTWLFQESELSKEEARENLTKKLAQETAYANMTRKLSTEVGSLIFLQSCVWDWMMYENFFFRWLICTFNFFCSSFLRQMWLWRISKLQWLQNAGLWKCHLVFFFNV